MGRRAKKRKAAAVASGVERSGDGWRPSRRQVKAEEQPKPVYREAAWGAEEDDKLRKLVAQGGGPGDWAGKAVELGGRDPNDVWTRWCAATASTPASRPLAWLGGDGSDPHPRAYRYLHLDPERVAVLAREQRHGWTGDTTASASSQAGGDGDAQQEPNKRARSEPRSTTAGATTDEGGQPKEAAAAQPASGPTLSQASFRFPKKKMVSCGGRAAFLSAMSASTGKAGRLLADTAWHGRQCSLGSWGAHTRGFSATPGQSRLRMRWRARSIGQGGSCLRTTASCAR